MKKSQLAFIIWMISTVCAWCASLTVIFASAQMMFREKADTFDSRLAEAKKYARKKRRDDIRAARKASKA